MTTQEITMTEEVQTIINRVINTTPNFEVTYEHDKDGHHSREMSARWVDCGIPITALAYYVLSADEDDDVETWRIKGDIMVWSDVKEIQYKTVADVLKKEHQSNLIQHFLDNVNTAVF